MRLRQRSISALLAVALLQVPVYAITPNTIRGYYGVQLQADIIPIKEELVSVSQTLRWAQQADAYNEAISSYDLDSLEAEINDYTVRLNEAREEMLVAVDVPLEELLSYEASYYSMREEMNSLLNTHDVVMSLQPIEHHEDVEVLQETKSQLYEAMLNAGYYEDIGRLHVWPVSGVKHQYNSDFGSRWDPITNDAVTYHSGVDLYAPEGTPVVAAFSGTVYATGNSYSSGNYIYLDHGHGVRTFYCHLSSIQVHEGENVVQGTTIALSGNTGKRTTGPHLHYGIYIDGTAVDPKVVLEHG